MYAVLFQTLVLLKAVHMHNQVGGNYIAVNIFVILIFMKPCEAIQILTYINEVAHITAAKCK